MIDDYGEGLYPDLLHYFSVDLVRVIEGDGPSPSFVLSLARALPDTSLTHALLAGGREHYGWGHDRHLLASIADGVQQNTISTGNWRKGKAPKLAPWPRPGASRKTGAKPEKRGGITDLFAMFKAPERNPFG